MADSHSSEIAAEFGDYIADMVGDVFGLFHRIKPAEAETGGGVEADGPLPAVAVDVRCLEYIARLWIG